MNRIRIQRRAARIGAQGKEYLLNLSALRSMVRDFTRERVIGYRLNPANRPSAQDKVFQARKFWFGDQFSAPASLAARTALRVACGMGSDFLAFRAAVMPGYYSRLQASRRVGAVQRAGVLSAAYENEGRN